MNRDVSKLELLYIIFWRRGWDALDRRTMAGNSIGKLSEFAPTSDSVSAYVERANLFFEANEIAAAKRVAVFLSAIGGGTYSLLRNLLAPTLPKDKTLDEIVDVLTKHYEPKTLVIAERFQFHRRNQAVGESVAEYVAGLRLLTRHCEFGAYLDDALRDRFVCGLRSEMIQKKLLTETDLTFQRSVEIAHTTETAAENARKLQSPSRAAEPMPHSRNIGKVSYNDRARPRTVIATGVGNQPTRPPSVLFEQQSVTIVVRQVT